MDELIGSLTECPLCREPMSRPKFLPCHHTFCCQCIKTLCENKRKIGCPLCRSPFNAPYDSDYGRLPANVYAEELVRAGHFVSEADRKHREVKDELEAVNTALIEARTKLAAQERTMMEVEGYQKAMNDAEVSLAAAKESSQNLFQQLQQTQQDRSKLAEALEELRKSEEEAKNLNDELSLYEQLKDLVQGEYCYCVSVYL